MNKNDYGLNIKIIIFIQIDSIYFIFNNNYCIIQIL